MRSRGAGACRAAEQPLLKRSAITGPMQGFATSFQGKGPQEEDKRPSFTGGKEKFAEVQPVTLQLYGRGLHSPGLAVHSHRRFLACLAGSRLQCQVSNKTGRDLDGRRRRSPPNPTQAESGPSLTHDGLLQGDTRFQEPSISITDQSCKMNSGALCTVRDQREEVRGKGAPTASRACPSALWMLWWGASEILQGFKPGRGSPKPTVSARFSPPIFRENIFLTKTERG